MTLLSIAPDIVAGASGDLENLGSALRSANAAAATQTTSIAAPAADEVSAAITALFGTHAQGFQALSAEAAAFHDDFVKLLSSGLAQYVSTEAANVQAQLGHAGSAAAAADQSYSGQFGPIQYSLNETATSLDASVTLRAPFHPSLSLSAISTSSGGDVNVTGTAKTLLGPVDWLTANGSASSSPDGAFQASLNAHTPFGPPVSLSLSGNQVSSGGDVNVTGAVNTPFGPLNFLTANGNASSSPDGAFQASLSAHTPFGPPVSLSLSGNQVSSDMGFEEALTGTGAVDTPFGPLNFLSANGNASVSADGAIQASLIAHTPIGYGGASVTGIENSDGTLQITGGSVNLDGLQFSI